VGAAEFHHERTLARHRERLPGIGIAQLDGLFPR
jgi:hypothetical protein